MPAPFAARVAIVGDRSPHVLAHARVPSLLETLHSRDGLLLDAYWVSTPDAATPGALDGFDAIWLTPGSPYEDEDGAIAAVRAAREGGVPYLGSCAGFQYLLIEIARNVLGIDAAHAEMGPTGDRPALIVPLACSLVGHEAAVRVARGSLAERVLGSDRSVERYHCSYGPDPSYVDALRGAGLRFSGVDEEGAVRIAELPGHPFCLATLFQPELSGDGSRAHPVIRAWATAAVRQAGVIGESAAAA